MGADWQVAWVTGASTGLGRELALELARSGVEVAASARSADKLQALARDNVSIEAYPVDVTDAEAMEQAVADIESAAGPIDLAILNAGVAAALNPQRVDLAAVRAAWETNYMGVVHGLAAVAPRMIARRRGRIAIVASVAGYRGRPRMGGYAPTKAALINLAECIRADLEPFGVSVSIINPGFIDTPLTRPNRFAMPFMLSAEDAARRVLAGLRRGRFEIAFPWQLVWTLKFMHSLPYPAYFSWLRFSRTRKSR
jgi:short-subunit dehydrogenase